MKPSLVMLLIGCGLLAGRALVRDPIAMRVIALDGLHRESLVPAGETRMRLSFRFSNRGPQALDAPRISRSCACTAATWSSASLEPGSTSTLDLAISMAESDQGTGSGTVRLQWRDGSSTGVTYVLRRKRAPNLVISPVSLARRALQDHPAARIDFVADYYPDVSPDSDRFQLVMNSEAGVAPTNVRRVGQHAIAGTLVLDRRLVEGVSSIRLTAGGLPEATLRIR